MNKKVGDQHLRLNVWRKGIEVLNLELNEEYRSDGYYAALGVATTIDKMPVHFFVRIEPYFDMIGLKVYAIEEFYGTECESETPQMPLDSIDFPKRSNDWRKLGLASSEAEAKDRPKVGGEGQGNTTGGGEPNHP